MNLNGGENVAMRNQSQKQTIVMFTENEDNLCYTESERQEDNDKKQRGIEDETNKENNSSVKNGNQLKRLNFKQSD